MLTLDFSQHGSRGGNIGRSVSQWVSAPLLSKLRYLNNYWMDCSEITGHILLALVFSLKICSRTTSRLTFVLESEMPRQPVNYQALWCRHQWVLVNSADLLAFGFICFLCKVTIGWFERYLLNKTYDYSYYYQIDYSLFMLFPCMFILFPLTHWNTTTLNCKYQYVFAYGIMEK